jgi:tRNA(fMet)-specific endonuclease VapC
MIRYVLDTDHLSLYERAHPQVCSRIIDARQQPLVSLTATVITVEEQYAGRLALIRKAKTPEALIAAYGRLKTAFNLFSELEILAYDLQSDVLFRHFRQIGIRIGTQDLRIASIALASNSTLVTRNLRDFEKVPELSIEDWSV